jgi:crotonobetainyl-CoA:carnitine CoA-transferase CaiB-like acyl-CoA transferase
VFGSYRVDALSEQLAAADIAFGRVNDPALLAGHPHLRRIRVQTATGIASYPAPAVRWSEMVREYGAVPKLGEHTATIRAEFGQN